MKKRVYKTEKGFRKAVNADTRKMYLDTRRDYSSKGWELVAMTADTYYVLGNLHQTEAERIERDLQGIN